MIKNAVKVFYGDLFAIALEKTAGNVLKLAFYHEVDDYWFNGLGLLEADALPDLLDVVGRAEAFLKSKCTLTADGWILR